MFDSVSRLLGFGGVGLASRKEEELWDENRRLRLENAELNLQVGIWRSELEDAQLKIAAWKAKADRRADKISELEAEVDELKNMLREAKYPATVRLEREMKVRNGI